MTPRKRKPSTLADRPSAKRASKARGARKQDDPVWATENAKSHLVNQDLHAKYCDPATYENWTKQDWEEIHDCLPDNVRFNEDGYSVPIHYFKYDPDWRRLVREFQEDLGQGRYEPEWQEEAAQAMEERAAGEFDKYKENQYEEFWGQKQKLKWSDYAGESAKIRLSELVGGGFVKAGDELNYRRAFATGKEACLIEKEIKVIAIEGSTMNVAIPPGQLKYARLEHEVDENKPNQMTDDEPKKEKVNKAVESEQSVGVEVEKEEHEEAHVDDQMMVVEAGKEDGEEPSWEDNKDTEHTTYIHDGSPEQDLSVAANDKQAPDSEAPSTKGPIDTTETKSLTSEILKVEPDQGITSVLDAKPGASLSAVSAGKDATSVRVGNYGDTTRATDNSQTHAAAKEADIVDHQTGCVLYKVKTISSFADKILEIDGRVDPKDATTVSNWRLIRVQRNNQDLGSLFDMREQYYLWKDPKIVKTPSKPNGKRASTAVEFENEKSKKQRKQNGNALARKQDLNAIKRSNGKRKVTGGSEEEEQHEEDELELEMMEDGSEDEKNEGERGSDGDFGITKARSTKQNAKSKATRKPQGLQGKSKKGMKHTHSCPHCHSGFTKQWSVKTHIERGRCKMAPTE